MNKHQRNRHFSIFLDQRTQKFPVFYQVANANFIGAWWDANILKCIIYANFIIVIIPYI